MPRSIGTHVPSKEIQLRGRFGAQSTTSNLGISRSLLALFHARPSGRRVLVCVFFEAYQGQRP